MNVSETMKLSDQFNELLKYNKKLYFWQLSWVDHFFQVLGINKFERYS